VSALSDVRVQLQDALRINDGMDVDGALKRALAWLEKGVDSEVWGTMRLLADEVVRLRPFEIAANGMADQERAFAQNCERVMAGMEVEVKALTTARKEAAAEVDRLIEGLNRIATDYDYSPAGKVAKQILGVVDASGLALPEVPVG
jgi:hypothetical protein